MPRNTDKNNLDSKALRRSRQIQAHGFIDDAKVAREERQRFVEVLRAGRNIEKDPGVTGICVLG